MIKVAIYIQNADTLVYDRVDLFDDEKISVTSSIQNINDISKTFTDYSQTFSLPASKVNNKIFKHWYENSRVNPFSTLTRANARIDIDGFYFRSGKIQLEACEIESGQPKSYSINFIGVLVNLKDKFSEKFLKDLNTSAYDFAYSASFVLAKVTSITPTSPATPEIGFPLITSKNLWIYGGTSGYRLDQNAHPIYYDDLFPSITLKAILEMIATTFGITFNGTFKNDNRFKFAHLLLKNSDVFVVKEQLTKINYSTITYSANGFASGYTMDLTNDKVTNTLAPLTITYLSNSYTFNTKNIYAFITPSATGKKFSFHIFKNGVKIFTSPTYTSSAGTQVSCLIESTNIRTATNDFFEVYIGTLETFTFTGTIVAEAIYTGVSGDVSGVFTANALSQTTPAFKLQLGQYMPDIKVEDFFTGLLKMFNLTCYSFDGLNYTIEQLETYYSTGIDRDFTKYIKADKKTINRVKTYKKVNFDYEKSQSFVNTLFLSNSGIDYGSLYYSTIPPADGEEYSIKLPFEDLNFQNLKDKLQVGYFLKTDFKPYIPKPIILYDYNPTALTTLTSTIFHFATTSSSGSGNGTAYTAYKAFGQEYKNGTTTFGLNFPTQQSTLTNEIITKGLYDQYYSNYFANIYSLKARLIKVTAILPTSVLVSLKLNDSILIRGDKFIINTMTTDLTTGETQFELLTDQRI